jgi:hypothetical protein
VSIRRKIRIERLLRKYLEKARDHNKHIIRTLEVIKNIGEEGVFIDARPDGIKPSFVGVDTDRLPPEALERLSCLVEKAEALYSEISDWTTEVEPRPPEPSEKLKAQTQPQHPALTGASITQGYHRGTKCAVEGCERPAEYIVMLYNYRDELQEEFYEQDQSCPFLCEQHMTENEQQAIGEKISGSSTTYPHTNKFNKRGFTKYIPVGIYYDEKYYDEIEYDI